MIITDKKLLSQPCKETSLFEAREIIEKLEFELNSSKVKGIGLSANQIGIDSRVCIIRLKEAINLVNPVIIQKYDLSIFEQEGCLSFPGASLITQRHAEIVVRDLLHPAGIVAVGLEAVCMAHEIDHINGITMFDRAIEIPKVNDRCFCGSGKKYKKCQHNKILR